MIGLKFTPSTFEFEKKQIKNECHKEELKGERKAYLNSANISLNSH